MKLSILEQITSTAVKGRVYAEAGEKVTLVADHGNVLIVSGKKQAFPVLKEKTNFK